MTHAYNSAPRDDRPTWQLPLVVDTEADGGSEWAIDEVLAFLDGNVTQLEVELFAFMRAAISQNDDDDLDSIGINAAFRRRVAQAEQAIATLREVRDGVAAIAQRFGVIG
jgi:hypothetical protein